MKIARPILLLMLILGMSFCFAPGTDGIPKTETPDKEAGALQLGAERFNEYLPLLTGKNVGLVVNQTSAIGPKHMPVHVVDTLLAQGVQIKKIFSPEHGFRGTADAGEHVDSETDSKTGLPIVSLYGDNKKPTPEQLDGLDVVIFDIQDVGARFYTYISTMHYVMEACAEKGLPVIILDRPNPNGFYVDGPVLKEGYTSFVGMHPGVPIVHGMTVGEYAQMINGEGWLAGGVKCNLTVISCQNYDHNQTYHLPIKPSPNLPNTTSIYLYPSLCLFEGTQMSIGRGTEFPFQVVGHPDFEMGEFEFTPQPTEGAKNPKLNGKTCKGYDLRGVGKDHFFNIRQLDLQWLLVTHRYFKVEGKDKKYFNDFFDKLAGSSELREQIEAGNSENVIRKSWSDGLTVFLAKRKKYLLYKDINY